MILFTTAKMSSSEGEDLPIETTTKKKEKKVRYIVFVGKCFVYKLYDICYSDPAKEAGVNEMRGG